MATRKKAIYCRRCGVSLWPWLCAIFCQDFKTLYLQWICVWITFKSRSKYQQFFLDILVQEMDNGKLLTTYGGVLESPEFAGQCSCRGQPFSNARRVMWPLTFIESWLLKFVFLQCHGFKYIWRNLHNIFLNNTLTYDTNNWSRHKLFEKTHGTTFFILRDSAWVWSTAGISPSQNFQPWQGSDF